MKIFKLAILATLSAALAGCLTSCAIGTAKVSKSFTNTNGIPEFQKAQTRFVAWGDARNAINAQKISSTKTGLSIGQTGFEQETSATNVAGIIGSGGELIGQAARSFLGVPPAPAQK